MYQYDSKNQLTYVGSDLTSGISYTYDANGNILTKTDHSTNTTINYGYTDPTWADLLTSYNGHTITYDEIGNPLHYYNGTAMDFSWVFGRSLFTVNIGDTEISYAYDQEGIRTSKTVGDTYTQYHIIDGIIYGEKTMGPDGTTEIFYFYDDNDRMYGFSYNGAMYYYQFNLQGDVTGIYDANGQLVVEYKYDAWGKILSITGSLANTIGQGNPIRYRGYYYDNETGFYYLISRYYDSTTGRFLSADSQISGSSQGFNLFAYCANNPISRKDSTGEAWETAFDIISLGASIIDVWMNPADAWAWAGLIGDTVDLIPFVTGVGEVTRALKTGNRIADAVDTVGDAAKATRKTSKTIKKASEVIMDVGYSSFRKLKRAIGSPGQGREWHHIVEQSQIIKSGFSSEMIQNLGNIASVEKSVHRKISGYYSSIQPFTNGLTVRNWLAGKSYTYQYQFGVGVIEMFK